MADFASKTLIQNGVVRTLNAGAGRLMQDASAPNGVNLGEVVAINNVDTENERVVVVTLPTADYSAYSKAIIFWKGIDATGKQITTSCSFVPVSGTITLGKESRVLGKLVGLNPKYELCVVDTSNRIGGSRGVFDPVFDAFQIVNPPSISGTFVEGSTMSPQGASYTGGTGVTVVSSYRTAKSDEGLDNQAQAVTSNITPEIVGSYKYIAYSQTFSGSGTGLPITVQSDWYEIIDYVAPPAPAPTYLGGLVDLSLEAGKSFSIDWDSYFSGATNYTVVTGLTGGVSSNGNNTNDLYTVSSLTGEEITFSITAISTGGQTNKTFKVKVVTPGVAPGLSSAVPDFIVPRGSTITYNTTQHFAGTALTYYSPDNDSNFALDSTGIYKSLVPLSSIIASSNKVFVAYNTVGTALTNNPISTTNASPNVVVTWANHSIVANDWVGITGATAVGGITLNGAYKVVSVVANTSITINARANASSAATGGGASVKAQKAAWDTVAVEITATPNKELTVDEVNARNSNFRYTNWRTPEVRFPGAITLASNPIATTNNSSSVNVTLADHKLAVAEKVVINNATAVGGITLNGEYTISDVPNTNTFTITAGSNATSTATGGGSDVIYTRPQTSTTLGSNPFSFTSSSSSVTVTWTSHPVGVGRVVEFSGATIAANLVISGPYLVISAPDVNTFVIDAGSLANATTTGGGAAVVATLRNHNQPIFLSSNQLTTTNGSNVVSVNAPNHMLAVGRPFTLVNAAAVGGITAPNLNGARSVLAVINNNTFTFSAGTNATSSVGGGGTGVRIEPYWSAIKWTRRSPDSNGVVADNYSEETPLAWQKTTFGRWEPHMESASNEGDPSSQTPTRLDYSVWNNENPAIFRVSYKETPTSLWSAWSGQVTVNTIDLPVTASSWLPISSRNKYSYDNDDPESRGQQFERVFVWYQGTNEDRKGWVLAGQDENHFWVSKDWGYSWKGANIPGLSCSEMAGGYLDDDVFICVGGAFAKSSWSGKEPFSGIFVGPPDLSKVTKLNLTRTGEGPVSSGSIKKAFVSMCHGGSFRGPQNCIGRRPQTGGLTLAQRPIWVVEQQLPDTGSVISGIYVWKIVLSATGTVGSATMVRSLPVATYGNGDDRAVYYVRVAPNGNVMLVTNKGIFLSTDEFATDPVRKYTNECRTGFFTGGSATTTSGAVIGDYVTGGVYTTTNVSTTAFSRPLGADGTDAGSDPDPNSGLPSAYTVYSMGVSGNTIAVCSSGKGVYKSTDLGKNFTKINQVSRQPSSIESWRYGVGGDPSGLYPSPNDPDIWLIHASQMLIRSTDGMDTMDPKGTVFCDGVHDKGWSFSATNPDKLSRNCQDNGPNTSLGGFNWIERNDLYSSGKTDLRQDIVDAGGGTMGTGYVTAAQGLFVESNNRVIFGSTTDGAGWPCVIMVLNGRTGTYGQYTSRTIISPNGSVSRCQRSAWSPLQDGTGFLGRWSITNTTASNVNDIVLTDHSGREFIGCALSGKDITLGSNPVATTNGSSNVVITAAAHGLSEEQAITLNGLTAVGGITAPNLNGARTITNVTTNTFTVTAGSNATSTTTGGGGSGTTSKALVSFWGNHNFTSGTTVYRSIQPDGLGQSLWYTFPTSFIARSIEIDRFHPTLNRLLYTDTGSKRVIKEAVKVGSTVTLSTLADLYNMTGGVKDSIEAVLGSGVSIPTFEILGILSDYNKSGLFYCYCGHHSHPNWFRTVDNGVTWVNISAGAPSTQWRGCVSPLTGDLIGSTSIGGYILPPPSDYPAITYRGRYSAALKTFYDKSTVPNPPLG